MFSHHGWGDSGIVNWAFTLSRKQGIVIAPKISIPLPNPYSSSSMEKAALSFISDREITFLKSLQQNKVRWVDYENRI